MTYSKQTIVKLLRKFFLERNNIHLILLCNVKGKTVPIKDYIKYSQITEFFSIDEYNELISNTQSVGVYTEVFYEVDDFINAILNDTSFAKRKHCIVYDTTQKGIGLGKDSLVPSFCDLHNIVYIGASALANSITSSKYIWEAILSNYNVSTPKTHVYSNRYSWLFDKPANNSEILIKPNNECASIGISNESKKKYNECSNKYIDIISKELNQTIIAQQFISGYEVETPIIITKEEIIVLPPIGLQIGKSKKMKESYLTYDMIYADNYNFYKFDKIEPEISKLIQKMCINIVKILDVKYGYLRIDSRVNSEGVYIIDINMYPHIISHSSFAYAFELIGIKPKNVLFALIGNALLSHCT